MNDQRSTESAFAYGVSSRSPVQRRRVREFTVFLLLWSTLFFGPLLTQMAIAQDENVAQAPAAGEPAPPDAAAPAAAPVEAAPASPAPKVIRKNFLVWMVEASGIFGALLLVLSIFMVALISMNMMQVNRGTFMPQSFVEEFDAKLAAKDYQGAYDLAKNNDSLLARVLTAGLGKLNRGYSEAIEAMQEVGEEENMNFEHRLSYLALIASIAPMLGLMGTVQGMIDSFSEIAESTVAPKPKDLARGISMALFTTLEGLIVAIPAMVSYNVLRNRVARLMLEVGIVCEGLMSRFANPAKPGAVPAKPAASSTS